MLEDATEKWRKKLERLWKTQVTAICLRDRLQNFAYNTLGKIP